MTEDPLYLVYQLTTEAQQALAVRDPDVIHVANRLARAGGKLRTYMEAAHIDADVVSGGGEPYDGFILPLRAQPLRRMKALLDEYVPCWADPVSEHPAIYPGLHVWQEHPESTPHQAERGYRRYICTACHRHGEEDSSG